MSFPCLELARGFHRNQNTSTSPPAHLCGLTPFSQSVPHLLCEQAKSLPMPPAMAFELAVFTGQRFLFLPPAQGAPECVRL